MPFTDHGVTYYTRKDIRDLFYNGTRLPRKAGDLPSFAYELKTDARVRIDGVKDTARQGGYLLYTITLDSGAPLTTIDPSLADLE